MILILNIILLFLVMVFVFWYCKTKKSLFNHVSIFTIGFFLYLIMPIFIGELGIVKGNMLFSTFNYIYERISLSNKAFYLMFILVMYLGFILGNIAFIKRKNNNVLEKTKNTKKIIFGEICKKRQIILGILLFIVSSVMVIKFWPYFFTGYDHDINRGTFAALILINFSFILIYDLNIFLTQKNWKKAIFNIYNLIFIILNVLLLSIGTRMYFISILFTLLVLLEQFAKIDKKKLLIFFIILFSFVGLIALLRSKYALSFYNVILTNLMEFLYTFISSLKFMQLGVNQIINAPIFLFSSLINLIPTFIFPDKLSYILSPLEYGYVIYSPQGALSIYADLSMNFGLIGTFVFIFLFGYFLEYLRTNKDKLLYLCIYSILCGFLGFSFFRDGFQTSLIKNILEFSILFPIIFYFILTFKTRRKNEKDISN